MTQQPDGGDEYPSVDIFADETCTTGHRFMAIGSVACLSPGAANIADKIAVFKAGCGLHHELKWENVSRKNLDRYRRICDLVFEHVTAKQLHFHSVVIDTSKLDHNTYNEGSNEIGFSKFVFQLLAKYSRLYGPKRIFRVALDSRETKFSLEPMRDMLNFQARKKYQMPHFPYRRLRFVDSKKSTLVQAADIITGAIGYRTNGKHLVQGDDAPKAQLSAHIESICPAFSLSNPTNINGKFTIWHMKLRERAAREPRL